MKGAPARRVTHLNGQERHPTLEQPEIIHYKSFDGDEKALLNPDEVRLLSIRKGSLDENERLQIESHVVHTFNFLQQIPWTSEIRNIPEIARGHHEKLNGLGYPYKTQLPQGVIPENLLNDLWVFDPGLTTSSDGWLPANLPMFQNTGGDWVVDVAPLLAQDVSGTYNGLGAAGNPGSRWGAGYWIDNDGQFWMFGGEGFDDSSGNGNGLLNDLWSYLPFPK